MALTKLTPRVKKVVLQAIARGCTREESAARARIATQTIRDWYLRGQGGEEPYASFATDLEQAEAEAIYQANVIIDAAAKGSTFTCGADVTCKSCGALNTCTKEHATPGQWQAAAWRNERKNPQAYGRKYRIDVHDDTMRLDEIDALMRRMARAVLDRVTDRDILAGITAEWTAIRDELTPAAADRPRLASGG